MRLFGGLIIIVFWCCSCNKEVACLQYSSITARIDFKTLNDTLAVIDTLLTEPILVFDSFYIKSNNARNIGFLMKSTSDEMQFLIATDSSNAIFDTVKLNYSRQLNFVNKECGYNYYYNLLSATSSNHQIKKVQIITPLVNTNINAKHLQIYY